MYTKRAVAKAAEKKKIPDDWCYIYNFENPNEPIAVSLPAGTGKIFKENMNSFVADIRKSINLTFNNEDFEKEKTHIKQKYDEKKNEILDKLNKQSIKHGFQVKTTSNGIYMMPVIDGKTIEEEEFNKLDENTKQSFEEKSGIVQEQIFEVIGQIKSIEKETDRKVEEWQSNIALLTINSSINSIKNIYKKNSKVSKFLEDIKKDILKNIDLFIKNPVPDSTGQPGKPEVKEPWLNYKVNLFVDNSNLQGAPVIMDSNYIYHNLFGKYYIPSTLNVKTLYS